MKKIYKILIFLFAAALLFPVLPARAAGTATVSVDLNAIGCGYLVSPTQVETDGTLKASEAVLRVLADNGYTAFYGGSPSDAFYLAYVADGNKSGSYNGYRSAAEEYPVKRAKRLGIKTRIPENVSAYLEATADYFDPADYETNFNGYIGEFVYTNGSGWMYALNGAYAQTDLASVLLAPGDTLQLKYTLWYGADVGGAEPALQAAFDAAIAAQETTTAETTTAEPTTAEPTTAEPTTAKTTTAKTTTAETTTAEPTTAETTTAETTTAETTTAETTTVETTTAETTTAETTTVETTMAESTTTETTTAETTTAETTTVETTTAETTAAEETTLPSEIPAHKNNLYWIIPAAAAVPVTALAVVIIKKTKTKENTHK